MSCARLIALRFVVIRAEIIGKTISREKKEMPTSWLLSSDVLRVRSPSLALPGQFHDVHLRCADKEANLFPDRAHLSITPFGLVLRVPPNQLAQPVDLFPTPRVFEGCTSLRYYAGFWPQTFTVVQ